MNKEQLKDQILTLLEDVFSFGFHYDEETNKFICEHDYDGEYANIEVDKEKIDFSVGGSESCGINYSFSNCMYIDKLTKLTKCLKEFYK